MRPAVKRRLVTLAAAATLLVLPLLMLDSAGCMAGVHTSRPEIRGTVVAATTAEPIGNATVTVDEDRIGNPAITVASDAQGNFRVPRATKFWVYWLMQGQAKWSYAVRAEAPGFDANTLELSETGQMPPKEVDGVRIELSRSRPTGAGG